METHLDIRWAEVEKTEGLFDKLVHVHTDRARLSLDQLLTNICNYYYRVTARLLSSKGGLAVIRTLHKLQIAA
jgi:hypothetical protein